MLMQSVAELLEHLYDFGIAGCCCFCAQLTDPVFKSAARHHEYESGHAYMRVDFLTVQHSTTGSEKFTAGSVANCCLTTQLLSGPVVLADRCTPRDAG